MTFRIRKGLKQDLPRLKDYAAQTYRDHQARHPQAFPVQHERHMDDRFNAAFRNASEIDFAESPNLLVAETEDGHLAGYILLSWFAGRPEGTGYVAQVEDIFTIPKYRNQGVARGLLMEARRMVGVDGLHGLKASVWAGTPGSEDVFQALDFIPERTVLYYGPPSPSASQTAAPEGKSDTEKRRDTQLGLVFIAALIVLAAALGAAFL